MRDSRARLPAGFVLLALVVVVILFLSPRHRQFYSRFFFKTPATPPEVRLAREAPTSSGRSPVQEREAPLPSPPRQAEVIREPRAGVALPRSGAGNRVVIPAVDGWSLKEFVGPAQVEAVREDSRLALRLVSQGTSFVLYRDVALDLTQFPILTWRWKVITLPTRGDVRERATDDQAAQVYLIFPRWPSPRISSDVMGYIWDSRAPEGAKLTSPQSANVKVVVLQSGAERLGRWVQEERNAYRDYVELFGRAPPRIGQVAVMVDSNDTQSQAEALIDDLVFLRAR